MSDKLHHMAGCKWVEVGQQKGKGPRDPQVSKGGVLCRGVVRASQGRGWETGGLTSREWKGRKCPAEATATGQTWAKKTLSLVTCGPEGALPSSLWPCCVPSMKLAPCSVPAPPGLGVDVQCRESWR